ncbi:hypothetical protein [Leptospira levettii]|uniref:SGNH/GDSL hydrolase family protein n=1 Tax=Leptospira levettii TaxID=2023178 RepID=A0AAW5V6L4_9LEPT|nr:hypothetical protein [Leptospira levettii]MCW7467462.1 hypothetical protein [Leptospira levettii]MCW7513184.1 hypothetical protein [Leptospira levettii]MCW7516682.1 hypothetical protein [Leptospira levettii]
METDSRVPLNQNSLGMKWKVFLSTIALLCAIFLFDRIFFFDLYFLFPNETEWDSSPWYNFIYKTKELQSSEDKHRTVVTGSSVALYSVLPDELNKKEKPNSKYSFFSHVAMAPTDLYYYKENLLSTKPNLVVYLHNFADLQWEYMKRDGESFSFDEKTWIKEFSSRYPTKTIYPTSYLNDYWNDIDRKSFSKLATKALFYVSRYRIFFWDPIVVFIDNHFRSGRKYHLYQGVLPKEGIWSKGWTKTNATIECKEQRETESIFVQNKNTKLQFLFFENQNSLINNSPIHTQIINIQKSGWLDIHWRELNLSNLPWSIVKIQILSQLPTAKQVNLIRYGKDEEVGVRLSHFFCDGIQTENRSYSRASYWDDTRFVQMSVDEFQKEYFERMIKDAGNRQELWRLHVVREAKKKVNFVKFKPWSEYNRILEISEYFYQNHIPFVIVLSPENPIEFAFYKNSNWRKEWISHLKEQLAKRGQTVIDHTEAISDVRYFFDPHHLTYEGAKIYNTIFESSINPIISKEN